MFSHNSGLHRSLTLAFEQFRFWVRIRGDIRNGKSIQFYQIKNRLAEKHTETHLFNKTVISIDDILNPGPEPLAGLRHGVPGEGPHHLPDLRDLGHGLVVKLCSDPKLETPCTK
jgi:hypothetical protein